MKLGAAARKLPWLIGGARNRTTCVEIKFQAPHALNVWLLDSIKFPRHRRDDFHTAQTSCFGTRNTSSTSSWRSSNERRPPLWVRTRASTATPTRDRSAFARSTAFNARSEAPAKISCVCATTSTSSAWAVAAACVEIKIYGTFALNRRVDLLVARNTLAETNIARSTSRASNDSNRISIASQEDFKF